jgi:Centromere protein Scm3
MSTRDRDSRTPDDIRELKHENNVRLRNAFDEIFEKYAHDFSGVGDEVDLATGEVVVNNGHLLRMRDERDTGLAVPSFLQDWESDANTEDSTDDSKSTDASDDGWEDVEETEMEEASKDAEDSLNDELAGEDGDITEIPSISATSAESPQRNTPNVGRERAQASPSKDEIQPQSTSPSHIRRADVDTAPPFDRQIVKAFVDNIANQITDFIMSMASSIQQHSGGPGLADAVASLQSEIMAPFTTSPATKRRRTDVDVSTARSLARAQESGSSIRNPLLSARLQGIRLDPKKHGHRGVTPGMPSLWSEDETDRPAKKKRRKIAVSSNGASTSAPSRLRNEVSLHDEADAAPAVEGDAEISSEESDDVFISSRLARPSASPANSRQKSSLKSNKRRTDTGQPKPRKFPPRPQKVFFSTKDDARMIELYYQGSNFEDISKHFPGSTKSQIRYHFERNLRTDDENSGRFVPRPNIATPPGSPRAESAEPAQKKSKSVTFAAPPSVPPPVPTMQQAYHMYPGSQPRLPYNQPHYYPMAPPYHPGMYRNPMPYGMSMHPVPIAPAPPSLRGMQRFEFIQERPEPIQFLRHPSSESNK